MDITGELANYWIGNISLHYEFDDLRLDSLDFHPEEVRRALSLHTQHGGIY